MLVSMALTSRLAYILRLNHENPRQKFLVQERRRRLMWAIYVMDSLYSSGKTEFTACTPETLHIRLPCAEKSFSMDAPVTTVPLHASPHEDTSNVGMLGYCIRVLDIRNRTYPYDHQSPGAHRTMPRSRVHRERIAPILGCVTSAIPQNSETKLKHAKIYFRF
ncbi:hypothetical protein DER46DRAFT_665394 [Fusarium sp. MPI-SDFR-AT-0072]|nr:hypothetical protein DER46DRAFT_665394 [Fusarium sp. MPI-SDFR-AT-0072]